MSDTPSQLLEEARKISDPHKILDDAQDFAHHLPHHIPMAQPGNYLYVWNANAVNDIVLALPDGGVLVGQFPTMYKS